MNLEEVRGLVYENNIHDILKAYHTSLQEEDPVEIISYLETSLKPHFEVRALKHCRSLNDHDSWQIWSFVHDHYLNLELHKAVVDLYNRSSFRFYYNRDSFSWCPYIPLYENSETLIECIRYDASCDVQGNPHISVFCQDMWNAGCHYNCIFRIQGNELMLSKGDPLAHPELLVNLINLEYGLNLNYDTTYIEPPYEY